MEIKKLCKCKFPNEIRQVEITRLYAYVISDTNKIYLIYLYTPKQIITNLSSTLFRLKTDFFN